VYRWQVNSVLARSEVRLRLAETGIDAGLLVQAAGDDRDDLVARAVPQPGVRDLAEHAVARFAPAA
jgi:hypothetical protein